jgi:hypothetical protein
MKNNIICKLLIACLAAFLALPAMAQEDELKAYPGYVEFGELDAIFGEPTTTINIGGSMLGFVGALSAKEDPEAASIFKRLHGVRVSVFENQDIPDEGLEFVKKVSSELSDKGWESVVSVNSAEEQVRILMKINGELVEGITVIAVEQNEAVFVNVIGNISPDEIEKVMNNVNVDID